MTWGRKRLLRLHLKADQGSLEGVYVGMWAGHYVLKVPRYLQAENQSVDLEGRDVKVHRTEVLFIQEL